MPVSYQITVWHLTSTKRFTLRKQLLSIFASSAQSVSIACDAWSSRVEKEYSKVTTHWSHLRWIEKVFCCTQFVLKLPAQKMFYALSLCDSIKLRKLERLLHFITADNGADIVEDVEILCEHLYESYFIERHFRYERFRVNCFANVLSLTGN